MRQKRYYTDAECKYICTSVFNGSSVPKEFSANSVVSGLSREGRVMRWVASRLLPEEYDRLRGDSGKTWPEASVQSLFLSNIEARAMYAFYDYCKNY